MGSKALLLLKVALPVLPKHRKYFNYRKTSFVSELFSHQKSYSIRRYSMKATKGSSLQSPDVLRLAETARISLTPDEVLIFAALLTHFKIHTMFGQLQAVDLNTVESSIRAETEVENLRNDIPETFDKREATIASVPSYEEP